MLAAARSPDNCPALVLNADYRPLSYFPLSLWSWQDAIKAVFLERVEYSRGIRPHRAFAQFRNAAAFGCFAQDLHQARAQSRFYTIQRVSARLLRMPILRRRRGPYLRSCRFPVRAGGARPGTMSSRRVHRAICTRAAGCPIRPACNRASGRIAPRHRAAQQRPRFFRRTICTTAGRTICIGIPNWNLDRCVRAATWQSKAGLRPVQCFVW